MSFIVSYDANVLYPNSLRDLLIRVAQAGLVEAKWTDKILDETFRSLKRVRPDLDPAKLDRTRQLMNRAIRDVRVTGYEPLIDLNQQSVYAQVQRMADAWQNPPGSVDDVLTSLEHVGLLRSVAALRA